jgi:hypothetical protein
MIISTAVSTLDLALYSVNYVEHLWGDSNGRTEVFRESMSLCHIVRHKSHKELSGIICGSPSEKLVTTRPMAHPPLYVEYGIYPQYEMALCVRRPP